MRKHFTRRRSLLILAILIFTHGFPGLVEDSEKLAEWVGAPAMVGSALFIIVGVSLFVGFIALELWDIIPAPFKRRYFKWLVGNHLDDTEVVHRALETSQESLEISKTASEKIKKAVEVSEESLEIARSTAEIVREIHDETIGTMPVPTRPPNTIRLTSRAKRLFKWPR